LTLVILNIVASQLDQLLNGRYNSQIVDFHIIDCRFDYEYNGGHIAGAVNINTTSGVEDFLLGSALTKRKQSVSGDPAKKTILVFHCEFSVKRAPTLYVFASFSRWILLTV
jgi:M-phase inducer tyrosine phosphatase